MTRNRAWRAWLAAAALACGSVTACEAGEPGPAAADVAVTDSAGQLHVRLGPLVELPAPPLVVEELFTSEPELFRVTAARLLPDGTLAVANSGTQQVIVLGPDGRELRRLGGPGEGPGEYRALSALLVDGAGRLVAYDPRLGRATTYGPDGARLATRRLEPPSPIVDLLPLALLDDDRVLVVYGDVRRFMAGQVRRDTMPVIVFELGAAREDTLGHWPGREWSFVYMNGGVSRFDVGFAPALATAGRTGRAAVGSTDSLDVTVYGPDGRVAMRVRGGDPRAAVDAAEVERWRAELLESRPGAPESFRRRISELPYHEIHPAFDGLLVDDAGRLWIGARARPGAAERLWIVVGTDGGLEGALRLPARARPLDAAGDRLVVLRTTELDEEVVAVLRVRLAGAESP